MRRYKLIGLTGQTGAGKSTVSQMFAACGAAVINADRIVSELYDGGSPCLRTVAAVFGADVFDEHGGLDRKTLAERAFSSAENTALLGNIVHPFVTARLFELLKSAEGIVIYDAPQLFESGADVICDAVICVVAGVSARLRRITARDGLTAAQAERRMNAQLDESFFREHADYVIENNGGMAALNARVAELYQEITSGVT